MYRIECNGSLVGCTEEPLFCYKLPGGTIQIVRVEEKDIATAIMFLGVTYNLPGFNDFVESETADVYECDTGFIINDQEQRITTTENINSDVDALIVDYEYRITMLELGL